MKTHTTPKTHTMKTQNTPAEHQLNAAVLASTLAKANDCQRAGFNWGGKQIFFVEPKGKDVSFNRWRMCFYYAPCMAHTEFFETQEGYDAFLVEAAKHTFPTYAEYRAYADARGDSAWIEGASVATI